MSQQTRKCLKLVATTVALCFALAGTNLPVKAGTYYGDTVSATLPTYNVRYYGAVCNGSSHVTADTSGIQAAINAAQTAGGGVVLLPATTCYVNATLMVTAANVYIRGVVNSAGNWHTVGTAHYASAIEWDGTSGGGPILEFTATPGASNQNLQIGGASEISFLSNNGLAAYGLEVSSGSYGVFKNIAFDNFTSWATDWTQVATLGEYTDDQHNFIVNLSCAGLGTGTCIYAPNNSGTSSPNGDFSLNTIINFRCDINVNSNCIDFEQADTNYIENTQVLSGNIMCAALCYENTFVNLLTPGAITLNNTTYTYPNVFINAQIVANSQPQIASGAPNDFFGSVLNNDGGGDTTSRYFDAKAQGTGYKLNGSSVISSSDDLSTQITPISSSGGWVDMCSSPGCGTEWAYANGSGLYSKGLISAAQHNVCSSSSGVPCGTTTTCSLSSATSCSSTVSVPSGSNCTASSSGNDTTTGVESWWLSLASNTLTVKANVSSSQTSTAAAYVACV